MHVQNYSRKANSSKKGLGLVATLKQQEYYCGLAQYIHWNFFFENISLNICS